MIEPGGVESPADEDIPFQYQGETVDIEAALALAMLAPAGRATWQENAGIDEATLARAHDRFEGIGKRLGEPTQSAMLANWHAGLDGQLARLEDALLKDRAHGLPKVSKARKGFERARPEGREADRRHGAKYRAKPEIKERDIVRSKLWRVLNHDKALLQPWIGKQKIMRDLEYHRPFVAIDAEGCDLPGHDIERDGAAYPAHATFLWGASGVSRDAHGTWNGLPLHWLGGRSVRSEVEPNLSSPGRENAAGGDEKRPLKTTEILDWLLSLPEKFGNANFCSFGFNYDVTMLLAQLTMPKVHEICKKTKFKTKKGVEGHVYCGAYTIDYLKGKRLVIKKFRNPDESPYNEKGKLRKDAFIQKITIYDLFGFYQTGFVKVMRSLQKIGLATEEECVAMERDKKRRNQFGKIALELIKIYTELELRKLSVAATVLRDGFDQMDIKLKSWSGAGSAAAAVYMKYNVPRHYAGWVRKRNPSQDQLAGC